MPPRRRRPADPARLMAEMADAILDDLDARGEPLDRARAATEYLALLIQTQRRVALARIDAVGELRRDTALSLKAIAVELGVSTNAIAQVDLERRGRSRRRSAADDEQAE